MHYIEKLKKVKSKKGYTFKQIGDIIGYTEANAARLFSPKNKNIPIEVLIKLCKHLEINLYDLLKDDERLTDLLDNVFQEPPSDYNLRLKEKVETLENEIHETVKKLNKAQSELVEFYKEKMNK